MSSEVPAGSGGSQEAPTVSEFEVLDPTTTSETSTEEKEETPPEEENQEEPEEETQEEEEEPEEEEEEEEEGEEEETTEEPTRPSWQTIKEKFPELAKNKDFKEMFFREKAFTEIFPTVQEARDASVAFERLNAIDVTLVDGKMDVLFQQLDPRLLTRISDKILPGLFRANKEAFARATRPLILDVLRDASASADRTGDENLKKSVRNLAYYLTGGKELPPVEPSSSPEIEEEKNRLRSERYGLYVRQRDDFLLGSDKKISKRVEQLVTDGLDPKNELTDFAKRAIIKETLYDIKERLNQDEGLRNKLISIFRSAERSGFASKYTTSMIAAYLERANKLVPMLRNKHKQAALGKQPSGGKTINKVVPKNETVTTGAVRTGKSITVRDIDTRKTSAEDFLNGRIVPRK